MGHFRGSYELWSYNLLAHKSWQVEESVYVTPIEACRLSQMF